MKIRISKKPFRKAIDWISKNPEKPLIYSLWIGFSLLSFFGAKYLFKFVNGLSTLDNSSIAYSMNTTNSTAEVFLQSGGPISNLFYIVLFFMGAMFVWKVIGIFRSSFYEGSGL